MLISGATAHAMRDVELREREVLRAFAPAGIGENGAAPPADLPIGAPAGAYFIVSGERGRMLYTPNVALTIADGVVGDASGRPLLGYTAPAASLQPLRADPVDAALGLIDGVRVEADGAVVYDRTAVDPRTGRRETQRATLGRLAVARFAAGTQLQAVDGQHAAAPSGIPPHLGVPGDGNFSAVTHLVPQRTAADFDTGLQRLQDAYLALDALRAAEKAHDGVQKTAMDLLK